VATSRIRALIVDDSALMRKLVLDMIASDPSFEVVGTARNGQEAVQKVKELQPSVVTMDVEMPVMDGLEALRQIMLQRPTPVVMLSSLTRHGADETIRSLELGAIDFVCKPSGPTSLNVGEVRSILLGKLRLAATAKLLPPPDVTAPPRSVAPAPRQSSAAADWLIAIGSSTGGPRALEAIIPKFPGDLPAGLLVAQHMPHGFTAAMAERLNSLSSIRVREAAEGDMIAPGEALIAPGGRHLLVNRRKRVTTSDAPPLWGVKPAVDLLMTSVAEVYGCACVGVILTGMGQDGARGMAAIRKAGGKTIAQDEATCVVYGMPKAAVEQGGVELQLPLPQIPAVIARMLKRRLTPQNARDGGASAAGASC